MSAEVPLCAYDDKRVSRPVHSSGMISRMPPPKPLHHHPPPPPPHEAWRRGTAGKLIISIAASTVVTTIVALIPWYYGISVNVILPASAPIWIGGATLAYMYLSSSRG
jgi:hypothetical protein